MRLLAINHHYVTRDRYSKGIYPVTPDRLEENIKLLLSENWTPINPETIYDFLYLRKREDKKYFIFTFDDGLKCQFKEGARILDKFFIPGIFFIPTCILEGNNLFVHKLHYIRSKLDDKVILEFIYKNLPEFKDLDLDEEVLRKQYRYDDPLSARLKYLLNFEMAKKEEKREELIGVLLSELVNEEDFRRQTYMDREEVRYLSERFWVGVHGHTHRPLKQLSCGEIYSEIKVSLDILKRITNREIETISYPYGGSYAVSDEVIDICRASGLKIGFTMERKVSVIEKSYYEPLVLGRIDVNDLKDFLE